mmetsp:Transcript_11720/g.33796  ORF Transcript_11720/g.33796 Transcript_11720/m.33796 type:complete len:275 (-) Transcript_11720:412-1236(-)
MELGGTQVEDRASVLAEQLLQAAPHGGVGGHGGTDGDVVVADADGTGRCHGASGGHAMSRGDAGGGDRGADGAVAGGVVVEAVFVVRAVAHVVVAAAAALVAGPARAAVGGAGVVDVGRPGRPVRIPVDGGGLRLGLAAALEPVAEALALGLLLGDGAAAVAQLAQQPLGLVDGEAAGQHAVALVDDVAAVRVLDGERLPLVLLEQLELALVRARLGTQAAESVLLAVRLQLLAGQGLPLLVDVGLAVHACRRVLFLVVRRALGTDCVAAVNHG